MSSLIDKHFFHEQNVVKNQFSKKQVHAKQSYSLHLCFRECKGTQRGYRPSPSWGSLGHYTVSFNSQDTKHFLNCHLKTKYSINCGPITKNFLGNLTSEVKRLKIIPAYQLEEDPAECDGHWCYTNSIMQALSSYFRA